ncbi:MAG: hypothetical protein IH899_09785, partial [Planctomycetes bacterium]|nr:hypothetical protein [Planctomycetota bacterium]
FRACTFDVGERERSGLSLLRLLFGLLGMWLRFLLIVRFLRGLRRLNDGPILFLTTSGQHSHQDQQTEQGLRP